MEHRLPAPLNTVFGQGGEAVAKNRQSGADFDQGENGSALCVALEAEQRAALYYGAVAEAFTGEQKQFFEDLSSTEEMHAERVQQMIEKVVI